MTGEHRIDTVEALEALYGFPSGAAVEKEVDHLHPHYQAMIAAAPFVVLATNGPGGVDASPRGDAPGFVTVADARTLLIPDRKGNNRADSLKNIIADPHVALLFLIPGIGETLRVNGRAAITTEPALLERFAVRGSRPRSVIVVSVDTVFFQCARAIFRSNLWDPARHRARETFASTGRIVADLAKTKFDAESYDDGLYERLKSALY
ncbi:MAG: pyridoxamine 5'-phosphate oxidase family protein [Burkholderiales bacterium]|nr:pyridoxamine 5'-phosphate oxidase family protein [Burkholderiales bacterium]